MDTGPVVTGRDGLRGVLLGPPAPNAQGQQVVRLESGQQLVVPNEVLVPQPDGSYAMALGRAELERGVAAAPRSDGTMAIPIIAESVQIQKQLVERGRVRVSKVVREREELVDEPLLREQVHVQRVPVNRYVDGPVPVRTEGETLIVPLLEEVLVVEKRLVLKEEMHITKLRVVGERHQERVTLRSEVANVERVGGDDDVDGRPRGNGVPRG